MGVSEAASLMLTGLFGLVSTVGVIYQVIDIKQRSRKQAAAPVPFAQVPLAHADTVPLAPPPVPRPYLGPPITPPVVVRARLLLLVTTFLTAVNVGIIYYIVQVEYTPAEETNQAAAFTAQIIAFLVTSAPLSVIPTVLSVFIGRGHDWARVSTASFVVLQAVCCTICGPVLPFSQPTETESGSFAPGGYLSMGIVTLAIGLVSVAIAIMLLSPASNAYFSAMTQWRRRAPGAGRPPAYR